MYFKRSDIQNVKNHITKHANEVNVMVGAKDDESYNKALDTILKTKQYYEGEQIDQKHMTVLKKNINNIIINTSNYLIKNADMLKGTVNLSNPVDYLTTAIDGFFITAMERLGCPNMPLPHFDPEIKNTLINSAIELNRSFAVYDFSKDDTFTAQRGKDAAEVNKIFGAHVKGLKENKAESVGKMVAEYQALRERQQNHGFFWRMLHRTENKARNDLLEKMKNFITNQLPGGMKKIDLDEVVPTMLARNLADACIRGEVEVAGVKRLDPKASKKVFGLQPSDEAIPDQQRLFDELSQKESMSKDANFVKDVLGNDHVKSEPTVNKNHLEKQNIIGKD